jgi:mRNA interferase HicA
VKALAGRLESGHIFGYKGEMKRRELERHLRGAGWRLLRHGGSHDVWTNGKDETPIPRHAEIREGTARGILRYVALCAEQKQ